MQAPTKQLTILHSPSHERHAPVSHPMGSNGKFEHVEAPRRIHAVLESVSKISSEIVTCEREATDEELATAHDTKLIEFISGAFPSIEKAGFGDLEVLPEVIGQCARYVSHTPSAVHLRAGQFCTDYSTPIGKYTATEARRSAALAIDGAKRLKENPQSLIYALCRPPGHHAAFNKYGGYCYFNNAALAAEVLKDDGLVTILDVDYHHGNGTQDIYYESNKVAYISIHADPAWEFPFHSGGEDELGLGEGLNYNLNLPLQIDTDYSTYLPSLFTAIQKIKDLQTKYLILSFGADTADGDPICHFHLSFDNFFDMGLQLGKIGIPTLVVQEGGYSASEILGPSAASLVKGLLSA